MKLKSTWMMLSVLLIAISFTAFGKTRNTLIKDNSQFKIATQVNPVLLGDLMIYQASENNTKTLWSHNITTHERQSLFVGDVRQLYGGQHLALAHSFVYFASGESYDLRLWRTDGTAAGTSQISDTQVFNTPRVVGDLIFAATGTRGNLVSSDGTTIIEHDIQYPNLSNICAFAVDDVISISHNLDASRYELLRSQGGQTSLLSEPLGDTFFATESNMWVLNDVCYIGLHGLRDYHSPYEIMAIPKNGPVQLLSQLVDLSHADGIFSFKDRLYVINTLGADQPSNISRLNETLTGFDATFAVGNGAIFHRNPTTSDNRIIASTYTPDTSPSLQIVYYFDANLIHQEHLGGAFAPTPLVYPLFSKELIIINKFEPGVNFKSLSFDIETAANSPLLDIRDAWLMNVITSNNSDAVYMLLRDKTLGHASIDQLADTPNINQTIKGIWHDPNIENQGVAITPGIRADGSEYLFVTVYTYRNGAPLWLAGVGEVQTPQSSIDVLLANYNGINTFESGSTPNQEIFGSVNFTLTGCNNLTATFDTQNDGTYVLDLSRIHNTEFSHLCND